jgi:glycosyltransferase involved in cell wall biosynthesis
LGIINGLLFPKLIILKKILFVVSEDWYFVSHRLNLAIAAINNDYDVALLTRCSIHKKYISQLGVKVYDWPMKRGSHNPFNELVSIFHIIKTLYIFKPNLVHSVAFKPVIYTLISNLFSKVGGNVLALGGLGFVFRSEKKFAKIIRTISIPVLRFLLLNSKNRLIIQNVDDAALLTNLKIVNSNKISLIRGAGVNISEYKPKHKKNDIPLVILPARMLWNKGVKDFVNCAEKFRKNKISAKFALIGAPDNHNPESVSKFQLKKWDKLGIVEWWGFQDNMLKIYNNADIVCFPSFHEGLPKTLLEAASCEIPIVAYNVSGCREVVLDNLNGFLVPFQDEDALYSSVKKLVENDELRDKMGKEGRKIVAENFAEERIVLETLRVWGQLLK